MSRTLEAIANMARGAVLAVAGLAYGCASSGIQNYHLRDVNADSTRDLIHERFGWNGSGQRTYAFRVRRGDNGDNRGTAADPSRFRAEVRGSVVLPSYPASVAYLTQDVDGDGRNDMLVVERDASGRVDLYVRQLSRGGDPLHLVVQPPTSLVEDRQLPGGPSPIRY